MANMHYWTIKMNKIKQVSRLNSYWKHNYRLKPTSSSSFDVQKNNLNVYFQGDPNKPFLEVYKDKVKECEEKNKGKSKVVTPDCIKALEFELEFSGYGMYKDNTGKTHYEPFPEDFNYDEWLERVKNWAMKSFGKENVISIVLHRDETPDNPHIHLFVLPVVNGKFKGSEFCNKRADYYRWRDNYVEEMQDMMLKWDIKTPSPKAPADYSDRETWLAVQHNVMSGKGVEGESIPKRKENETENEYQKRLEQFLQLVQIETMNKAAGIMTKYRKKLTELNEKLSFMKDVEDANEIIEKALKWDKLQWALGKEIELSDQEKQILKSASHLNEEEKEILSDMFTASENEYALKPNKYWEDKRKNNLPKTFAFTESEM